VCALFVVAFGGAAAYSIWVYTVGLEYLSPAIPMAMFKWAAAYWVLGVALFLALVTMLTWALMDVSRLPKIHWRPDNRGYLHERRLVPAALTAVAVWDLWTIVDSLSDPGGPSLSFLADYFCWPWTYFAIAILVLGLRSLFARRRLAWPEALAPVDIPAARFCGVWLAVCVLCFSGATALGWTVVLFRYCGQGLWSAIV
jgi:hypothetical protein